MRRALTLGRGIMRSFGQVAVSVVATLIATQIYATLRDDDQTSRAAPPAAPALTSGGKFDARVPGATSFAPPEPPRPVLSIVDWSITAPRPTGPVADVGWGATGGDAVAVPRPALRSVRHEIRRSMPAPAAAAVRPASIPQLDLHATPAAPEIARSLLERVNEFRLSVFSRTPLPL